MVLHKLAESALTVQDALRGAQDVVTIWQETGKISGGVGGYVKDVPDVRYDGKRCPLQDQAQGKIRWNRDMQSSRSLTLW